MLPPFARRADLKLHLQGTDYGNFLADEAGTLSVTIIQDKLLQKFVEMFETMRTQLFEPANTFFDYMTYVLLLLVLLPVVPNRMGRGSQLSVMCASRCVFMLVACLP